jgi:predicted transcriptional regulator of viral defense system
MTKSQAWPEVLSLADEQWGLVTTQQVEATGVAWSTLARQVQRRSFERIAHGVYRVRGGGQVEQLDLRAAWLQLSPATPAWARTPAQGVVSHRSAAALYELGHLPADVHEFTLPARRQTRRPDVRLHRADLPADSRVTRHGLPVARPARIAVDLLADREDPGAVGELIADALRAGHEDPGTMARAIARQSAAHGLRRGDGLGLLGWLLGAAREPARATWLEEAAAAAPDLTRGATDGR